MGKHHGQFKNAPLSVGTMNAGMAMGYVANRDGIAPVARHNAVKANLSLNPFYAINGENYNPYMLKEKIEVYAANDFRLGMVRDEISVVDRAFGYPSILRQPVLPRPFLQLTRPVVQVSMFPAPTLVYTSPVIQSPAPIIQLPAPINQAPAPAIQAPAPVIQPPAPVIQAPAPVIQAQPPRTPPVTLRTDFSEYEDVINRNLGITSQKLTTANQKYDSTTLRTDFSEYEEIINKNLGR